ncbi:MAG: type II toxin-antitoxin system RelE/ParE family toxin [Chloroflexota bacterium]
MKWEIEYTQEAKKDLIGLDNSQRIQVLKAIRKVSDNPLPAAEGGYGKPLGNRVSSNLAGYLKIKLLKTGLRVVYGLVRNGNIMRIIIISVRDDETVYKLAQKRIR